MSTFGRHTRLEEKGDVGLHEMVQMPANRDGGRSPALFQHQVRVTGVIEFTGPLSTSPGHPSAMQRRLRKRHGGFLFSPPLV